MPKFYVVWKGRQPGVYATWDEARAQVDGFPGAQYASTTTEALARAAFAGSQDAALSSLEGQFMASPYESQLRQRCETFINATQLMGFSTQIIEDSLRDYSVKLKVSREGKQIGKITVHYSPNKESFIVDFSELVDQVHLNSLQGIWYGETHQPGYWFYVDGSYIKGKDGVGWSVIVIFDGKPVDTLSGCIEDTSLGQVLGELQAAQRAVQWCREQGVTRATIAYDYEGVGKWAMGQWNTKDEVIKSYSEFMQTIRASIDIEWQKIDAHTGNRWNEQADKLAKRACI